MNNLENASGVKNFHASLAGFSCSPVRCCEVSLYKMKEKLSEMAEKNNGGKKQRGFSLMSEKK